MSAYALRPLFVQYSQLNRCAFVVVCCDPTHAGDSCASCELPYPFFFLMISLLPSIPSAHPYKGCGGLCFLSFFLFFLIFHGFLSFRPSHGHFTKCYITPLLLCYTAALKKFPLASFQDVMHLWPMHYLLYLFPAFLFCSSI